MKKLDSGIKEQVKSHGISTEQFQKQLDAFHRGIPPIKLKKAATLKDGISVFTQAEQDHFIAYYDNNLPETILKFIPASGAATRMFKDLQQFASDFDPQRNTFDQAQFAKRYPKLVLFFDQLGNFAFFPQVKEHLNHTDGKSPVHEYWSIAKQLLNPEKFDFANVPKGLVPFHNYGKTVRSAFEEHFHEATFYASANNNVHCHFTVADNHLPKFKKAYESILTEWESGKDDLEADFSVQKKATDTIAVDLNNQPVYFNDKLYLRPGGHGALIANLNDTDADLIFIKNIDNVIKEAKMPAMAQFKKMLGGVMLEVQHEIFSILKNLDQNGFSKQLLEKANALIAEKLGLEKTLKDESEIRHYLNRPIRVCGMVKNEGDPGGGPFWIEDGRGDTSLQIIETAQIDQNQSSQKAIMDGATHFNPVDLVCGIKNYRGEKFNLLEFINDERGFITQKTKGGQQVKALELPGLWNGAMEYWNTVFVEVPYFTFNPVKSVVDLLKENHQPE